MFCDRFKPVSMRRAACRLIWSLGQSSLKYTCRKENSHCITNVASSRELQSSHKAERFLPFKMTGEKKKVVNAAPRLTHVRTRGVGFLVRMRSSMTIRRACVDKASEGPNKTRQFYTLLSLGRRTCCGIGDRSHELHSLCCAGHAACKPIGFVEYSSDVNGLWGPVKGTGRSEM